MRTSGQTYSFKLRPISDQTLLLTGPWPRALSLMIPQPETCIYRGGFPGLAADLFCRPSRVAVNNWREFEEVKDTFELTFDTVPVIRAGYIEHNICHLYCLVNDRRVVEGAIYHGEVRMYLVQCCSSCVGSVAHQGGHRTVRVFFGQEHENFGAEVACSSQEEDGRRRHGD